MSVLVTPVTRDIKVILGTPIGLMRAADERTKVFDVFYVNLG